MELDQKVDLAEGIGHEPTECHHGEREGGNGGSTAQATGECQDLVENARRDRSRSVERAFRQDLLAKRGADINVGRGLGSGALDEG